MHVCFKTNNIGLKLILNCSGSQRENRTGMMQSCLCVHFVQVASNMDNSKIIDK